MKIQLKALLAGSIAGAVNGLFGAGGGMLLVPLYSKMQIVDEENLFPASVSTILPITLVSLIVRAIHQPLPFSPALPYLIGGAAGGILAGLSEEKIPVKWLHRFLGILILWGGIRYLC